VNHPLLAIKAVHLADAVREPVPMRLRQVVDLMDILVHAACRYFMKQRLPQMRPAAVDERDDCFLLFSKIVAELCSKLEPACSTSDDHDAM
jgi:hypothetical protein